MKTFRPLLICILLSFGYSSFAQLPSVALGVAVKQLSDELQQAIENAKNAGLNLEIEAGREVAISIENFKNAYASSLDLTFKKLDVTAANQFESLKGLTDQIQNQTVLSITDITSRAQQIVDALPFRSHQPHLRTFSPTYIVPSSHNYDVTVICSGNFDNAGSPEDRPSLVVGEHKYIGGGGNQSIEFHIPISIFMGLSGIQQNKFGYVKCELSVPWEDKYLMLFPSRKVDTYDLYIGSLPKQPGQIALIRTTDAFLHKDSVIIGTPPFYQSSCSDGGNNDKDDVPYILRPTPGWTFVKGSSSIAAVPGRSQGDFSFAHISDEGNQVQYNVTTHHHGFRGGPSGCLAFTISLKESIDIPYPKFDTIPYNINWGDSKTIDLPVGKWKVQYFSFDGSTNEFAGDDNTNPFIQIIKTGMTYKLVTANPSTLTWH